MSQQPSDFDMETFRHECDRRRIAIRERFRQWLISVDRPDLLADFDSNMRDVDLGLTAARNIWHSISAAQRHTLKTAIYGPLERHGVWYGPNDGDFARVCKIGTIRNLIARSLVDCDGGAFDPEARVVISDHGRFVVKHGPVGGDQ